jgi:hypothetical protein
VLAEHQLNVYDVLNADNVIFVRRALDAFQARAAGLPGRREVPAPATEADAVAAPAQADGPDPASQPAEPAAEEEA